jgi:hypothetical protein
MATAIQVIGAALIVAGIGLMNLPVAVIVAGVAAVFFGVALERN